MKYLFIIIMIISMLIAFFALKKGSCFMVQYFLFMVLFQNFVCIWFSPYISKGLYAVFTIEKELMLYLYFLVYLFKNNIVIDKYTTYEIITFAVFLVLCIKNTVFTSAGLTASILSLRYMLLPMICVFIGKTIKNNNDKHRIYKSIVIVAIIVAVGGIIERFALGDSFWTSINYGVFADKMKGNRPDAFYNGVTVNFYTWDYFGVALRRIVSIVADPLISAYLMFLGCLLLVNSAMTCGKKRMLFVILSICLYVTTILCFSKAIYVLSAIFVFCYFYYTIVLPKPIIRMLALCGCIILVGAIVIYLSNAGRPTSIMNHLIGVIKGINYVSLFGNGLGMAGSSVQMFSGEYLSFIRESYIGSLLAQVGLVGLASFTVFFMVQIKKAIQLYRLTQMKTFILSISITIGLFMCMFFSDSAVSVSGTGVYFLLIGMINNKHLSIDENTYY